MQLEIKTPGSIVTAFCEAVLESPIDPKATIILHFKCDQNVLPLHRQSYASFDCIWVLPLELRYGLVEVVIPLVTYLRASSSGAENATCESASPFGNGLATQP
jgi:hypothetical protein